MSLMMNNEEVVKFNDQQKFEDFLNDKEDNHTERKDVNLKNTQIIAIDDVNDYVYTPVVSDAAEDTILFGTHLFLWEGGNTEPVPVRECALQSIEERMGISGPALDKMSPQDLAKILNMARETDDGTTTGKEIIVDGKVNAYLSSNYVPHPASEIFMKTEDAVNSLGNNLIKFTGNYSYDGVFANFVIDRKLKLDDGTSYDTVLTMSTSDVGKASVSFGAGAYAKGYMIPLVDPEYVVHKNHTTKNDVLEKMNMVISSIDKSLQRLEDLKTIEIQYPITTMKRLAKAIRLPKKPALIAIERFRVEHENSTDPVTAFDVYMTLCRTEENYRPRKGKLHYVDMMHHNLLKLLGMSFVNYDMPGEFNW